VCAKVCLHSCHAGEEIARLVFIALFGVRLHGSHCTCFWTQGCSSSIAAWQRSTTPRKSC
jgi:hypothetical protein